MRSTRRTIQPPRLATIDVSAAVSDSISTAALMERNKAVVDNLTSLRELRNDLFAACQHAHEMLLPSPRLRQERAARTLRLDGQPSSRQAWGCYDYLSPVSGAEWLRR